MAALEKELEGDSSSTSEEEEEEDDEASDDSDEEDEAGSTEHDLEEAGPLLVKEGGVIKSRLAGNVRHNRRWR